MICGIIAQRVVPGSSITSDDTISVNEGAQLAHTLTATDFVEWSIVSVANGGAADAARFSISGSTLRWLGNGAQDFEDPIDANADNVYEVTVRAVNLGGGVDEQNISVTVLDTGIGTAPLDGLSEEPTSAFSLSRNLIGAYDGGDFYAASSGLITQLDDQTGAGRHLTALTTARPAVSSAGAMGRACADFNGTANVMAGSGSTYADLFNPTAAYVIISAIVTSIGTNDSVVGQNDALWTDDGQSFGVALKSGTPSIHAFQTNAGPYNSTTHTLTLGVPFVFELKRSGTVLKSRLNGGSWTTAGMSQTEAIGTGNIISIGANAAPEQFSDCSVFEFVTYDAVLTDAEEDALAADMLEYIAGVEGEAVGSAAGVGAASAVAEALTTELWTPTTDDLEAGVALWFDAADGTTITESGGAISQWDDSGAASLHVTQSSAGSKPTYVEGVTAELNGLGYVEFDGGDYLNKTSALGSNVPFVQTTFMVALPTGEGTSVYWTTNGSAIRGNIELALTGVRYQGSSSNYTSYNPSDLWHVYSGHIGGGGTRELYVDGLLRDSNSTGTDTGTPLPTQIWLGSAGGDSYFIGRLGEFVQYDGLLGTADRRKVEGYLAWKWGLETSLPIDHPYRDEPPFTAGLFSASDGLAEGDGAAAAVGLALSVNSASGSAAGTGASSVVGQEVTEGPHRYWRIFAETNNGDASFIGASQIEMYEAVYSGPNVLTGGTASASSTASGSFPASNCVNNTYHPVTNNRWASTATGGTNEWWKYDFGASNDKEIVSIGVFSCTDTEWDQTMKIVRVEYSDDDSAWTTSWTDTLTYTASDVFRRSSLSSAVPSYSGSPYGTHTYWRILFQSTNGVATSCAELEMRATTGGADQCSGGTPTVASSTVGSASSPFDNNSSTHWAVNGGAGNWIKYQFASPVTVGQISFQIRGDSNPTHSPNDMLVQFSDDNTKWTTAWQILNESAWTNGETRVFTSPDYV